MICDSRYSSKDNVANMLKILTKQKVGLKIVHLNAQSLNNKLDEFKYIFISSGVDIICISETWFHNSIDNSIYDLPGFNLFRSDRKTNGGGVCVYIRNGIICKEVLKSNDDSRIEYLLLEISTTHSTKILIGCVYRPNRNISLDPLLSMMETMSVKYEEIIIVGDFNSNLITENILIDAMLTLDLHPTNYTMPTHSSNTINSLLDVFFVNKLSNVLLYDQLLAPMFSKHDLIFLIYNTSFDLPDNVIYYRDFNKLNYCSLSEHVNSIPWECIYDYESIDDQVSFMEQNVNYIYNACVPIKTKVLGHKQQPWFNADIRKRISLRDDNYRRWRRFKTPALYLSFKKSRKEVVKCIKLAKSAYYGSKFSAALNSKSKWKEIRDIGIGKRKMHNIVSDVNADALNKQFIAGNPTRINTNVYENIYVPLNLNMFSFRCVSQSDVLKYLLSVKSNAVGLDEVNPKFVRIIAPYVCPYITYIFNTALTKSVFPSEWKCSKIIPIPKADRKQYRPIAILPYMSKVLEKIMHDQINDYLCEHNLLTKFQSGYRKKRSCITALTDITEDIRQSFEKNMVSFLVLLDHSKAFDTVNHTILLTKLSKLFCFANSACKLIEAYLKNRSQTVFLGNSRSEALINPIGVPQGSILGPLLFCLYINDLPNVLRFCKVQLYADDVQLLCSTNLLNIRICLQNINEDLKNIDHWALSNGLHINPSKSKCIFFSRNKTFVLPDEFSLKIGSSKISFVLTSSNLGVIFNGQLSWTNHINSAVGRVYGMLRNLWAVKSATPFHIRLLLAKTYLIPVLLYGSELFQSCDSSDFRKLKVTYNNIARYVFNKKSNDRISNFSYMIFNMKFENVLKFKPLMLFHKIIYSKEPDYLFERIKFGQSSRKKIVTPIMFKFLISERQFFISATRLWNNLPSSLQLISNAFRFKKELKKYFE